MLAANNSRPIHCFKSSCNFPKAARHVHCSRPSTRCAAQVTGPSCRTFCIVKLFRLTKPNGLCRKTVPRKQMFVQLVESVTLRGRKGMSCMVHATMPKLSSFSPVHCRCDGEGRIAGGLGAVVKWFPIKAYRPCPAAAKGNFAYTRSVQWCGSSQNQCIQEPLLKHSAYRRGQITDEVLFGKPKQKQ